MCFPQAKGGSEAAARQLATPEEVARVWPLVEPFLLQDIEHVTKYKGGARPGLQIFMALLRRVSWDTAVSTS